MAFDSPSPADVAALTERQDRLRAWAGRIAHAVEAIDLPETFLDGERAARAITVADRMLCRLPEAEDEGVSPARQRLRVFADAVFAVVQNLHLPKTFVEGERAGRCVLATAKLFEQLYAPKRPRSHRDDFDLDAEPTETPEDNGRAAASARIFATIDQTTFDYAREVGFYPDGSVCDPAAAEDPARLSCPDESDILAEWLRETGERPPGPGEGILPLARIMTARANASARARARHDGQWPDGRAFHESDGPSFVISQCFAAEVMNRPGPGLGDIPPESPGPKGFPWWLVQNPDTG